MALLVVSACASEPSTADRYMSALESSGLSEVFVGEIKALDNAEEVCSAIYLGGKAQGSEADRIGVEYYCHEYADAFGVLLVVDVSGSFTLVDAGEYGYLPDGARCEGEGGYGDISSSTAVVLVNSSGTQLARTTLDRGQVDGSSCVFQFTLPNVEEGADSDSYMLSVGRRGEVEYSFFQLSLLGPALSMGD